MLSGVSNFIKKSLPLRLTGEDSPDQPYRERGSSQRGDDRVEDGFLLVGDTASDRSTVYTSSYRANQVDRPPGYSEVCASYMYFIYFSNLILSGKNYFITWRRVWELNNAMQLNQ